MTSYDVAVAAGVAQSTVSRCFRSDSSISDETRALVVDTARRLGYRPNALARGLIMQRSNLVGVIATPYTLRGNPDVIYALGGALAAAGKQLLLVTAQREPLMLDDLRRALEYPLDGLISCVLMADDDLREIARLGVPLVLYNRQSPRIEIDAVSTDHRAAAAELASALHAAGHRRFLFIGGPANAPVSQARREGFARRLKTLPIGSIVEVETEFSYAGGRDAMRAHVKGGGRPHAVFTANDQLAFGAMDACRFDLGLAVPGDVSVIGFDDVPEASRPTYDLTTMRQDSVAMAGLAVDLLTRRLAEPSRSVQRAEMRATLITRSSARL